VGSGRRAERRECQRLLQISAGSQRERDERLARQVPPTRGFDHHAQLVVSLERPSSSSSVISRRGKASRATGSTSACRASLADLHPACTLMDLILADQIAIARSGSALREPHAPGAPRAATVMTKHARARTRAARALAMLMRRKHVDDAVDTLDSRVGVQRAKTSGAVSAMVKALRSSRDPHFGRPARRRILAQHVFRAYLKLEVSLPTSR